MKQMKIKNPGDHIEDIRICSSHIVDEDDLTGELEIEEFSIKFQGQLSGWIEEYLTNPLDSRLHKRLAEIFSSWFE